MGRIFLEHMGGKRLYSCMKCKANLTNYDQLISTNFSGTSGTAFLFNKVVNITFSEVQERMMGSGRQFIRVVSCKKCNLKLGYIYEFAQKDGEQYKEGKIMLERSKIIEEDGLENEI